MADNCSLDQKVANMAALAEEFTGESFAGEVSSRGKEVWQAYTKAKEKQTKAADLAIKGRPLKGTLAAWTTRPFGKDGVPLLRPSKYVDPSTILGKEYTQEFKDKALDWRKFVYDNKVDDITEQRDLWKDMVGDAVDERMAELEGIDPSEMATSVAGYARKYLQQVRSGVELFGDNSESMTGGLIRKSVSNNPVIFGLNFLEYSRAFGMYGPKAAVGVGKALAKTKGQFWKEVPELQRLGVYGRQFEPDGTPVKYSLITLSDNWLRTSAYYTGAMGKGGEKGGLDATRKIAFAYQPGDTPEIMRDANGRDAVVLMRYGIEQFKHLGQGIYDLAGGTVKGDPKRLASGAGVLAAYYMTGAIAGGNKAVLPDFLWDLMPEDWQDGIKEFDESQSYLNVAGKYAGTDLTGKLAPGAITYGVGYEFLKRVNQKDLNVLKIMAAVEKGDLKEAWTRSLRMGLSIFKLTGAPISNVLGDSNTQKLFDASQEWLLEEVEEEELWPRYFEKVVPFAQPVTDKGKKEQKQYRRG